MATIDRNRFPETGKTGGRPDSKARSELLVIRLERDGFRWELASEVEPCLTQLLSEPGALVKEAPAKRVSRHEAGGRVYYVKRYRHDAMPLRPLKFFIKSSPARKEWEVASKLEALGVPAVRHVAHGERWDWRGLRESILITEGFHGRPLDEIPGLAPEAVLSFVTRLHDCGVLHADLHSGNILASTEPLEFRLLDLDKTRVQAPLTAVEREDNLAFLAISFPLPLTGRAAKRRSELRRQLFHERSRRCLRHNREFAPQRRGRLCWRVRLPLLTPAVARVLADPDDFLRARARILKPGSTTTVGVADGLVLKRFNFRKLLNLGKDLLRRSRASRAFRKSYHLELAGIPTARVVAVADRRIAGFLACSYQVMEEIPGAITLQKFIRSGGKLDSRLIRETATLVARLHDEGFTHRDLNERNLVLDANGAVFLIDLDALEFTQHADAALDLGRLARDVLKHASVTRSHRQAFLRHYCRLRGLRRVPRG
jgi:tRNA A-37 threonylcarbamoyl transferase component Bud32